MYHRGARCVAIEERGVCHRGARCVKKMVLLWKEAQPEVRQHWFIYSYIAAYIQALYMYCPVWLEYIRLVLPPARDLGRVSTILLEPTVHVTLGIRSAAVVALVALQW